MGAHVLHPQNSNSASLLLPSSLAAAAAAEEEEAPAPEARPRPEFMAAWRFEPRPVEGPMDFASSRRPFSSSASTDANPRFALGAFRGLGCASTAAADEDEDKDEDEDEDEDGARAPPAAQRGGSV